MQWFRYWQYFHLESVLLYWQKNLVLHICMQVWSIFKFKFAITIQVHKYIALNYSNMYAVILKRSVLCIWFCRFSKFKFRTTITLENVAVKITTAKQINVCLARFFKNYKVQWLLFLWILYAGRCKIWLPLTNNKARTGWVIISTY